MILVIIRGCNFRNWFFRDDIIFYRLFFEGPRMSLRIQCVFCYDLWWGLIFIFIINLRFLYLSFVRTILLIVFVRGTLLDFRMRHYWLLISWRSCRVFIFGTFLNRIDSNVTFRFLLYRISSQLILLSWSRILNSHSIIPRHWIFVAMLTFYLMVMGVLLMMFGFWLLFVHNFFQLYMSFLDQRILLMI